MYEANIGWALSQLKRWIKVYRLWWNGSNMWLELQIPDENSKMTMPYIYMCIKAKRFWEESNKSTIDRVPWLASQTDILGTDWMVMEEED